MKNIPLIDARSPSEYAHSHIPGAINIPLLDDEHRKIIGTTYKQQGREAAVLKGFDLVGPKFGDIARAAKSQLDSREVKVYCWRGGMRSHILSWVLELSGFKVTILKGGYKAYRNKMLAACKEPRKVIVLGGRTGSGKTELLKHLAALGEQVIDLESLAHHKGSAFGALGELPQPRYEYFENQLAEAWLQCSADKVLWLENESRLIGQVKIPDIIYDRIRKSPMIEVVLPHDMRVERIMNDYGKFPKDVLIQTTEKIKKRLGGLRLTESIKALEEDRRIDWVNFMLEYYDKMYDYGNTLRKPEDCHSLAIQPGENFIDFARRIQQLSAQITFHHE